LSARRASHPFSPVLADRHVPGLGLNAGEKMKKIMLMAGVVLTAFSLTAAMPATPGTPHQVWICHATSSATNPYVAIHVDVASKKYAGHLKHAGDIFGIVGGNKPAACGDKPPVLIPILIPPVIIPPTPEIPSPTTTTPTVKTTTPTSMTRTVTTTAKTPARQVAVFPKGGLATGDGSTAVK